MFLSIVISVYCHGRSLKPPPFIWSWFCGLAVWLSSAEWLFCYSHVGSLCFSSQSSRSARSEWPQMAFLTCLAVGAGCCLGHLDLFSSNNLNSVFAYDSRHIPRRQKQKLKGLLSPKSPDLHSVIFTTSSCRT